MLPDRYDPPSGDEPIVAEINVTPLTDIFLVLLIIFMVTSSALTQSGSHVDLPRSDQASELGSALVVTATADRRLEVNGTPVTIEGLAAALQEAFRRGAERNVVLRGDREMVLERAVRIMAIAREAGAQKIAIATAPGGGR